MADNSITIAFASEEIETRVLDGFAGQNGYMSMITPVSGDPYNNPESKEDFLIRYIKKFIIENVTAYEINQAASEARQEALDNKVTL